MTLTTGLVGLLLTLGSIGAFIGGGFPRARVIGIITGIVCLFTTGPGGHLFRWGAELTGWASSLTSTASTWAFGVGTPALFSLICAGFVIWDMHPRFGGRASRRTFWFAAALGIMIAAGTTNVALLNNLGPQITHGVQTVHSGALTWTR